MAFTALYPNEQAVSSADFLNQARAYFQRFGITTRRVFTDNGPCFLAHRFRDACRALGITPKRTRHYRPQTNGKAERFIQTAIREWAYAATLRHPADRLKHLPHGPTSTTGTDPTQASTENQPSQDQACRSITC